MPPRVLISDKMSPLAEEIFRSRGIDVDVKTGLSKEELADIIGAYDGLAIRSATRPSGKIIERADRLKVIGRAGIGVDNIDLKAATARGIIVMNTPFGNSITTAEHAISLMLALARQIPQANSSTHAGKWEKSRFMGVELTGKTFGLIGCGNIGTVAATRAQGLKMKVIAFDPYLSEDRARDLGVEKVDFDTLLARADFISLHTPLTDKTRNIIDARAMAKMKKGAYVINCARGGLVVEADLKDALESGHLAGAALDVFEQEPARDNPLFGMENVICTPHLGASTSEAQENVAQQVAEQMSDYLLSGAITNAINFPSISAEEAPVIKPFVTLAEQLGSFSGQVLQSGIRSIRIEYAGDVADMNTKAMTAAVLAGVLRPFMEEVNMVSAAQMAEERGIKVFEETSTSAGVYESHIRVVVTTDNQERSIAGTVFSGGLPRVTEIKDIPMEGAFAPHMLYTENSDKPGFVGALGETLGKAQVNIATFTLGRTKPGGDAIALIEVDEPISDEVITQVRALPHVMQARRLRF